MMSCPQQQLDRREMRRCKCVCALLAFVGLGTVILLLRYSGQNWTELTVVPFQIQRVQPELNTTPATTTTPPAIPDNPIPGDDVLKQMSHKDLQEFYHSYINSPQTTCSKVVRMGKITDGGWELCDDPLYRPIPGDCLVYSYGINFDFSFDTDMSRYGCTVHAFDPSMKTVPNIFGGNIYFHATGVAAKNATINSLDTGPWQLHTVKEHRDQHHHSIGQRQLDIIKMDVEGYEYESLMLALEDGSLSDVRQLAFETHVTFATGDPTQEDYIKFLGLLRSVYHHGFRIYLTHRNYVWSSFESSLNKGKKYAKCHEIHTVNINLKNGESKLLASFRNNSFASEASRTAEHELQAKIVAEEVAAYKALILRQSPG